MDYIMDRKELTHWIVENYPMMGRKSIFKVSSEIFGGGTLRSFNNGDTRFLTKAKIRDLFITFPNMPESVRCSVLAYEKPEKSFFQQRPKELEVGKRYRFKTNLENRQWLVWFEGEVIAEYKRFYVLQWENYMITILKNDLVGTHQYDEIKEV